MLSGWQVGDKYLEGCCLDEAEKTGTAESELCPNGAGEPLNDLMQGCVDVRASSAVQR